jgi:hypothetical protein
MHKEDLACVALSIVLFAPAVVPSKYEVGEHPHTHQESTQPFTIRSQAAQVENVKSQKVNISFNVDAHVTTPHEWSATQ